MIQRDVSREHVEEIKTYLKVGKGKAVFFPPLLVSLIVKRKDGSLQWNYDAMPTAEISENKNSISLVWDKSLFKIVLRGQPTESENKGLRALSGFEAEYYFHHFGANLDVNSNKTKLVVIDGQHRYKALTELHEAQDYKEMVAGIEVPICVVFSPFAVGPDKSGIADLRDLFVTVNTEAAKVSGHFLRLLSDDKYSSEAVRRFATIWKEDTHNGYSLLHHLEWNTHDEKRAGQLNRPYSITTVNVICDALKSSCFRKGVGADMLLLSSIQEALSELDEDFSLIEMEDDIESNRTRDLIFQSIGKHVAMPLATLFTKLTPYASLIKTTADAVKKLRAESNKGTRADLAVLLRLIDKHQIPAIPETQIVEPKVVLAYEELCSEINADALPGSSIFRLAVFQHALIRSWSEIAHHLLENHLLPEQAAVVVVGAFNNLVVANGFSLLTNSVFTARLLWQGEKVSFKTEMARTAWTNLLIATLSNKGAREAGIKAMESEFQMQIESAERKALDESLREIGNKALGSYLGSLFEQIERFFRTSYSEIVLDDKLVDKLESLKESSDPNDREAFVKEIQKLAKQRYKEAEVKLSGVLGLRSSELATIVE
jgi:hypothetical protein